MKENIISEFAIVPFETKFFSDSYVLNISFEYDNLYFEREIEVSGRIFRNNPLIQYIISYIAYRGGRKFTASSVIPGHPDYGWEWGSYGIGIKDDVNFPWLEEYLVKNEIVLYNSKNELVTEVLEIGLSYYDSEQHIHKVDIPRFDDFFKGKTREEMIEFMNDLYKNYGDIYLYQ